jgi:hypothetical protein
MMPSDELHDSKPFMRNDFEGISIHDALIVQKAVRARMDALKKIQGLKIKPDVFELGSLDIALSLYIVEEVRKTEEVKAPY